MGILVGIFYLVLILLWFYTFYIGKAIPPKSKTCLVGKTAIVTGANRGILVITTLITAHTEVVYYCDPFTNTVGYLQTNMSVFIAIFVLVLVVIMLFHLYTNKAIPPKSKMCLVGKTAIVTGANRGIGYEVALGLAQRGCKVIIACRSSLEATKQKIIEETKNPNIVARHLDLLSFDSVTEFAKKINETEERLDILIHNAVIVTMSTRFTTDALNPIMQVNHFSSFLLTHLLVDLLKKSSPSRVIFVSSFLAFLHDLTVDNLNYPRVRLNFQTILKLYSNCKLCNLISASGFSRRLKRYGISVNAVHPGLVNTSIFVQLGKPGERFIINLFYALVMGPFSKSPAEGAYPIIEAATHEKYQKVTGKFLYGRGIFFKPWCMRDREFCDKIWSASEDYAQLQPNQKLSPFQ